MEAAKGTTRDSKEGPWGRGNLLFACLLFSWKPLDQLKYAPGQKAFIGSCCLCHTQRALTSVEGPRVLTADEAVRCLQIALASNLRGCTGLPGSG